MSFSDAEYARRAQRGDPQAFLALVHRYHPPLYKLAYRFAGSVEQAEDLCQEIVIRAFRQIDKFDHKRPFLPWMMRVASNVCLNWREAETRRTDRERPLSDELVVPASHDVELELIDRIESREIVAALGALSPDIRLLMVMRFSLGLTFREISEQTGVKLPTVAARISRGVDTLRIVLHQYSKVYER